MGRGIKDKPEKQNFRAYIKGFRIVPELKKQHFKCSYISAFSDNDKRSQPKEVAFQTH
ncbi:hypothetical protein HMPREF1981_02726 [Bacteroides pyogenes F0041]|uniref:Uncharacterized protein n=1 Tax=Bacteroides pyogenes F0041 TaxID=1321819 RepID=U2DQN8_9BACE|nr:hypothetical protein HMPREF1981_02726 [Bacteroides pyogenes F0041]GAE21648.1 hypothetical protein JCM10003_1127 [Bacteroides pyogenes JCM 10003]